jgi:hydroxyacylglutathione hydrolase
MLGVLTADHLASLDADVVTLPSIPAASLAPATDGAPLVLDVRNRSEWDAGHMPGAVNIPLAELATRVEELRAHGDQPIAVHCQGGSRSGFSDVSNVEGGFGAWARAGNRPATGT